MGTQKSKLDQIQTWCNFVVFSCGSYFYPNCYSSSVSSKVRNACDGEPQCTLTASDRIYGDPCSVDLGIFEFDTDEFLKVSFICVAVPG